MNFEDYLRLRGLSQTSIVDALSSRIQLQPGEIVFASGSVVEGLGNLHSDLDIFVLTERDLTDLQSGPAIVFFCGETPIDVEVWSPRKVEETVRRVYETAEQIADPRYSLNVSVKDIHRSHACSMLDSSAPSVVSRRTFRAICGPVTLKVRGF